MSGRGRSADSRVEHGLAWLGIFVFVVSFVWLQLLPKFDWRVPWKEGPKTAGGRINWLVMIDAGHGGPDSGAICNGVLEKELTLDVARRVERLAQEKGFRTSMTRRADESVSLAARAAAANRERDCVFLSIHFDEGARSAATGVQTFYAVRQVSKTSVLSWLAFLRPVAPELTNFESQSLAGFVQEALVARTQAFSRGTNAEQFYVIANVRHPAVLVEGGFLSNNNDLSKLTRENYREQLALAIAEGLVRYREIASQEQLGTLAIGVAKPE